MLLNDIIVMNKTKQKNVAYQTKQKGEEFSDNDNADYFDEYERIHHTLYQNGYLQHVFNSADLTAAANVIPTATATTAVAAATNETGATVGDDNQNVAEISSQKSAECAKNTNTSSSKSSSSNQSELLNLLPHYQPRWHQQLTHSSFALRNPLHPAIIKAHLDSVNHEIAQLDSRIENVLLKQHQAMNQQALAEAELNASTIYRNPVDSMVHNVNGKMNSTATTTTTTNNMTVISASPAATAFDNKFASLHVSTNGVQQQTSNAIKSSSVPRRYPTQYPPPIDSDTEHIYETIPEDSDLEPIYCSPYKAETDSETNLVHEWLDLKDGSKRCAENKGNWTRKSNSSVEDHENSSSAYNTGGSCNSNHQLTLELSDTNNDDGNKTLVFCPTKHLQPKFPMQHDTKSPTTRQSSSARSSKEKALSPTHNNRRTENYNEQPAGKKTSANNQGKCLLKYLFKVNRCCWCCYFVHSANI